MAGAEHLRGRIVARQRGWLGGELRTGLERELIVRKMRWRQRQRVLDVAGSAGRVLAWQRIHQVEVEVRKAGGVQLLRCARRLGRRVDAPELFELSRIE